MESGQSLLKKVSSENLLPGERKEYNNYVQWFHGLTPVKREVCKWYDSSPDYYFLKDRRLASFLMKIKILPDLDNDGSQEIALIGFKQVTICSLKNKLLKPIYQIFAPSLSKNEDILFTENLAACDFTGNGQKELIFAVWKVKMGEPKCINAARLLIYQIIEGVPVRLNIENQDINASIVKIWAGKIQPDQRPVLVIAPGHDSRSPQIWRNFQNNRFEIVHFDPSLNAKDTDAVSVDVGDLDGNGSYEIVIGTGYWRDTISGFMRSRLKPDFYILMQILKPLAL